MAERRTAGFKWFLAFRIYKGCSAFMGNGHVWSAPSNRFFRGGRGEPSLDPEVGDERASLWDSFCCQPRNFDQRRFAIISNP